MKKLFIIVAMFAAAISAQSQTTKECYGISVALPNQYKVIVNRANKDVNALKANFPTLDESVWNEAKQVLIEEQCKALVTIINIAKTANKEQTEAIMFAATVYAHTGQEEWNLEVLEEPGDCWNQFHTDWIGALDVIEDEFGLIKTTY